MKMEAEMGGRGPKPWDPGAPRLEKARRTHPGWRQRWEGGAPILGPLEPQGWSPYKRWKRTRTRSPVEMEAEVGWGATSPGTLEPQGWRGQEGPILEGGRGGREGPQAPGPWSPKAGEGRKDPILEPLEGPQPCATLVSGVWSPGPGEDELLLL